MYKRSRQKHETIGLTDYALKYIRGETAVAGKHLSVKSSNDVIMVCAPNGASNIVNLSEGTCTCLEFQDKKLPYRHAILACREFNLEPEVYASQVYSLNSY